MLKRSERRLRVEIWCLKTVGFECMFWLGVRGVRVKGLKLTLCVDAGEKEKENEEEK
tara:strand:- start:20945 stop:21115 length:171 start_codon:yes stop_codon:yes gene_type:complete